jgi:hypothetical protein
MEKGWGCVDLQEAAKRLARSSVVREFVKSKVGEERFPEAIRLMKAGTLDGDIGATIDALLGDSIRNDATEVWSGRIEDTYDNFPLHVYGYHGVYWVWTIDYDPVGYFTNKKSAIAYAFSNWDNVFAS